MHSGEPSTRVGPGVGGAQKVAAHTSGSRPVVREFIQRSVLSCRGNIPDPQMLSWLCYKDHSQAAGTHGSGHRTQAARTALSRADNE